MRCPALLRRPPALAPGSKEPSGAASPHVPHGVGGQPLLKVLPVMVFFSTDNRSGIARFKTCDHRAVECDSSATRRAAPGLARKRRALPHARLAASLASAAEATSAHRVALDCAYQTNQPRRPPQGQHVQHGQQHAQHAQHGQQHGQQHGSRTTATLDGRCHTCSQLVDRFRIRVCNCDFVPWTWYIKYDR